MIEGLSDGKEKNKAMIHAPNQTQWVVGDVVIHDFDSKKHEMLMVVVKVTNDGVTTKYLHPESIIPFAVLRKYGSFKDMPQYLKKRYQKTWYQKNTKEHDGMEYLHSPDRFQIEITEQDRQDAKDVAGLY